MHLDEEQIQRLLHGEPVPAEASVREHLARCADCRERLARAAREEDDVHALLRRADRPLPRVSAEAVAARARAGGWQWGRWAAGVILAVGFAGAVYAAPGSPVPAWVDAVAAWVGGRSDAPSTAPAPAGAPDQSAAGIAVLPGPDLVILFTSHQAKGQARVSLTDGAEVVVRTARGAATFTSGVDRLVIDNRGSSATFEIQIPRAAPRVEIQLGDDRVFLKEGARITAEQTADARAPYLLPLTPPRP